MISRGVKLAKNVGVIIKFDDVEYSEEERNLLWGRFALFLAKAAEEIKENENAKCFNISNNKHQKAETNFGFTTP